MPRFAAIVLDIPPVYEAAAGTSVAYYEALHRLSAPRGLLVINTLYATMPARRVAHGAHQRARSSCLREGERRAAQAPRAPNLLGMTTAHAPAMLLRPVPPTPRLPWFVPSSTSVATTCLAPTASGLWPAPLHRSGRSLVTQRRGAAARPHAWRGALAVRPPAAGGPRELGAARQRHLLRGARRWRAACADIELSRHRARRVTDEGLTMRCSSVRRLPTAKIPVRSGY